MTMIVKYINAFFPYKSSTCTRHVIKSIISASLTSRQIKTNVILSKF